MEFVVAEVERRVDGLEGFEINVEFALLAFVGDDVTAEKVSVCWGLQSVTGVPAKDNAVGGDSVVEFESLLG